MTRDDFIEEWNPESKDHPARADFAAQLDALLRETRRQAHEEAARYFDAVKAHQAPTPNSVADIWLSWVAGRCRDLDASIRALSAQDEGEEGTR